MEIEVQQATHHERVWRRRQIRSARRDRRALDRGVSAEHLSPADRDAQADSISAGTQPMGPDGFSFATPRVAGHPGLLQPQGPGIERRTEKESLLRAAGVLQQPRSAIEIELFQN